MINPHNKEEELIKIIKYQTSYYTSVDSKYVSGLPDPKLKLTTKKGQQMSLRTFLLNIKTTTPEAGNYNIFTQINKGLTIKTSENQRFPPRSGITFTFQISNTDEAQKIISQLHTIFSNKIQNNYHYLLIPQLKLLPATMITNTPPKNSYASQFLKRMK